MGEFADAFLTSSSEEVIMPTPVPVEDIEGMRKKIREEEIDLQRLKELAKEERKIKHAAGEKDTSITIGSNIRVVSGPYANFEGCIMGLANENREVCFSQPDLT